MIFPVLRTACAWGGGGNVAKKDGWVRLEAPGSGCKVVGEWLDSGRNDGGETLIFAVKPLEKRLGLAGRCW